MRIWIKGTEIPGLGMGSTFKRFKTWAPNSGRSVSGVSTGRVLYKKWKAFVKCPMLTAAQFVTLRSLCEEEPQYFAAKVIEDTGTEYNLTMYSSDVEYSKQLICGNGEVYYQDVSVELVEE